MTHIKYGFFVLLVLTLLSNSAVAQPSPGELADQMEKLNQDRLSAIESLEMTVQLEMGEEKVQENTTRFVKRTRDGKIMLVADDESDFHEGRDLMEGIFDGSLEELVRGAESAESSRLGGQDTYKLLIRDKQLLNILEENDMDAGDREMEIDHATLWIDRERLVPLRMIYGQQEGGEGVSVEISMEDYEMHSGLPIAGTTRMEIKGISSMFTEEEIEEARRAMEEMKEQLAQMPESQREMIENQMEGRMNQFEQILQSGSMGETRIKVISVTVNP